MKEKSERKTYLQGAAGAAGSKKGSLGKKKKGSSKTSKSQTNVHTGKLYF